MTTTSPIPTAPLPQLPQWAGESDASDPIRYHSLLVPELAFMPTRCYAAFCLLCDTCATYGYSAVVTGETGVGKTRAAAQYADRWLHAAWGFGPDRHGHRTGLMHGPPLHSTPRSLVYAPHPFPRTERALATDLLNAITACERRGGEGWWDPGNARGAADASLGHASTARGTLHLLIVDDADTWASRALAHVLEVGRERNLGVVLLGSPALRQRLETMRALSRQVDYWFPYRALLAAEVRAIVTWTMVAVGRDHRPGHAPLRRFWTAANTLIGLGGSNMRVLRSLLQYAVAELVLRDRSTLSRALILEAAARWGYNPSRPHLQSVRFLPLPLPRAQRLAQPLAHSC